MSASSLAAFWLLAALLIVVPGADWAFTLAAGARSRAVGPAVAGLAAGYCALTAAVSAGVGALVAGSPAAMTALTVAGGAYLVWHGATTLLSRPAAAPAAVAAPAPGGWPVFRRGVGVSALNPKALLLFLALLPQFTDPAAPWPVPAQLAALGLTFTATCAAFYTALGTAARTLLSARPRATAAVTRTAGAAMLLLGAALLAGRLVG
ncbi:LysE family translocator [Dactylosporangium darangshiense]|uniref:LysE family transporter n=1 Tax=Dactylosporangium darangshiense TaxID=579108 RepID=A0ABP8D8Q1_9ACTN